MAGDNAAGTQAAAIDYDKLGAAVAAALKPSLDQQAASLGELAKNQKVIADTFTAQPAATAAAAAGKDAKGGAADGAKPVTLEDVAKLLDQRLTAQQTTQQQTAQRDAFIADKLKDLPAAYRNQLGSDPTKWAAEEQQIRDAYKADFKTAGGTTSDVGGDKGGGAGTTAPAQTVDLSKLSPTQLIAKGLQTSAPQGAAAAASTRTMQTAATAAAK